ncbi:hypothetical protein [Streptomyces sp. NPDC026589]|uniref:hypothetical protein n=1 Tax=Streptomyces sp. NPDC026589 TaxID=3155609 RepID=UPI0033CE68D9
MRSTTDCTVTARPEWSRMWRRAAASEGGDVLRHQLKGLAAFLVGLTLTSGSLALLHRVASEAGARVELVTLVVANLAATLLGFLLLRAWVFPGRRSRRTTGSPAS